MILLKAFGIFSFTFMFSLLWSNMMLREYGTRTKGIIYSLIGAVGVTVFACLAVLK